jgi:hypothetical protein
MRLRRLRDALKLLTSSAPTPKAIKVVLPGFSRP